MNKIFLVISMSFILFSCAHKSLYNDPIPTHDKFTINSKHVLEERVINVWLPNEYSNTSDSFPVLYMPDGRIKEDFPHIANTVSKLVEKKIIPPIILVGIENTERGRDLTGASEVEDDAQYCPTSDGAKNFRAFITEELRREIELKYRTTVEKGIMGESLAGLFVMETFLVHPETFDFYIAMDPSLWWNDHYLEKHAEKYIKEFPNRAMRLWFAGSSAEDISVHTRNMAKKIENSAPKNLRRTYSDEPKEKHNTIFRATKEKALIWILDDNTL